jgi:hypothetical protein
LGWGRAEIPQGISVTASSTAAENSLPARRAGVLAKPSELHAQARRQIDSHPWQLPRPLERSFGGAILRRRSEESLPHEQLVLTVLPMSGHIGTRFIQMNMLVYMIYPRKRDEVMVLPVWWALFGQFNLVRSVQLIDLSNRFSVGRNDVHVFFDFWRIRHRASPWDRYRTKRRRPG